MPEGSARERKGAGTTREEGGARASPVVAGDWVSAFNMAHAPSAPKGAGKGPGAGTRSPITFSAMSGRVLSGRSFLKRVARAMRAALLPPRLRNPRTNSLAHGQTNSYPPARSRGVEPLLPRESSRTGLVRTRVAPRASEAEVLLWILRLPGARLLADGATTVVAGNRRERHVGALDAGRLIERGTSSRLRIVGQP
jgi:hypothetical protein